jgi:dihydroorotase
VTLLLRNARLVDPAAGVNDALDLVVGDGRVLRVGTGLSERGATVLDLGGFVVCPGFIDMHVHLREPGQEWKETVASGTRAAARGGFTAVACMPNTVPPNDTRSVTELIMREAREHGAVRVHPIACVTKGQQGRELVEMDDLRSAGVRAFSDDGKPVGSSLIMRRALEYSKAFDVPIIDHCEDLELVDGGVMNEGPTATRLGLRGWPGVAEDVMVMRDILLADHTGGHVHIAHMTTARAAEFVRRAKRRGVRVSCEVTPHHLLLTDEAVGEYDTHAKMNPPLRFDRDRRALVRALADGTVDAIATDHAPHHADEKCVEFSLAPFGVVGLETAVALALDRLVRRELISLSRLVELFSVGPARVLRLNAGRLAPGDDADITVLDLERTTRVEPAAFASLSRNTPFAEWTLTGAPVMTIVGGRIVHDGR